MYILVHISTTVVLVTVYEDVKPKNCYIGHNVEVLHVYKGRLSVRETTTLRVLPVDGCPDPMFNYGKDYLVGGNLDGGELVVGKNGIVWDCEAFTPVLPDLCP